MLWPYRMSLAGQRSRLARSDLELVVVRLALNIDSPVADPTGAVVLKPMDEVKRTLPSWKPASMMSSRTITANQARRGL
jgi:hypothetical protein